MNYRLAYAIGFQPWEDLADFAPRRRGPLPRGASRADVEHAFRGWEITDVEIADTEPDALARLLKFDERFYRLRRRSAA